jgi:hypothetical protein
MFNQFFLSQIKILPIVLTIILSTGCTNRVEDDALSSYQKYLDSLKVDIVHSIPPATKYYLDNFKTLAAEQRDSAFFIFTQFYYKVKFKLNDSLMYDLNLLNKLSDEAFSRDSIVTGFKKIVKEGGFKIYQSEGYYYIEESPDYLYSKFGKYVSAAISEYLSYRRKELNEGFTEDAVLMIPFVKIAKRIIYWEKYLRKFPNSYYLEQVNSYIGIYLNALLGGLDNSPIFDEKGNLIPEAKKTYEYFIQKSDSTKNFLFINDVYLKLEKNSFKQNNEILDAINNHREIGE